LADEPYRCTRPYAAEVVERYTGLVRAAVTGRTAAALPPALLVLTRLQLGMHSILGALGASANWHQLYAQLARRKLGS
jgi:hypothetical protein